MEDEFLLGVDIGTSSVKICLVNVETRAVTNVKCNPTEAKEIPDHPQGNVQNAHKILATLKTCLESYDLEDISKVKHVATCGQMHGVVLWKASSVNSRQWHDLECSLNYTWQDQRCSSDFLATFEQQSGTRGTVSTGYGCATLYWLSKNKPELIREYDRAGTIMELFLAVLSGQDEVPMSAQNAFSWGCFDNEKLNWSSSLMSRVDFPIHLLPKVQDVGTKIGIIEADGNFFVSGTKLYVASGDMQCAVIAALDGNLEEKCAVMNLNTSAQLAFVSPVGDSNFLNVQVGVEQVPFSRSHKLNVFPCLNGGNVLDNFVESLSSWMREFNIPNNEQVFSKNLIWKKIIELEKDIRYGEEESEREGLRFDARLFGERYDPSQRATLSNICPTNTNLMDIVSALCLGIVQNLSSTMSSKGLQKCGIESLKAAGGCLMKHPALMRAVEHEYRGLHVIFSEEGHSCVGAALFVLNEMKL